MIKLADEYNFPIIEMPSSIAYIDIINTLLSIILDKQSSETEKMDLFNQKLNKLVLSSGGERSIIETIAKQVNKPIVLLNTIFEVIEQSENGEFVENFKNTILQNIFNESIDKVMHYNFDDCSFLISPINIEDTKYGYVVFLNITKDENYLYSFLEIASTNLAMEFLKSKIEKETEIRIKDDIVYDVLLGNVNNENTIRSSANYIGWNIDSKYSVAVFKNMMKLQPKFI